MPSRARKSSLSQEPHRGRATGQLVTTFLADLAQANRSTQTCRAYRTELSRLASFHPGSIRTITVDTLRAFLATRAHRSAASRARTQAALASFFTWAYRHEEIKATPMARIDRVRVDPPKPRWLPRAQVEAILATIPAHRQRDRVLYHLITECGLRAGEALGLHVEDLDLTPDDEHVSVLGKGGRRRTVLLDDLRLVGTLRAYLKKTGYRNGPLFRAEKNGTGGPLRYQSAQVRWTQYCTKAGVRCSLHQLRHSHATELVNDGVSLATIRKRLGHKNLQTTLRYADKSDASADAEIRVSRRRRDQARRIEPSSLRVDTKPRLNSEAQCVASNRQAQQQPKNKIRVRLWLNVQNNNKFVRGRKKAKEEIERYCLQFYDYRNLDNDGMEYELTIPYDDDADLEKRIYELLRDIGNTAEDRHCSAEWDVRSVDDPDRAW